MAIVIGGGNIFRGSQAASFGMERAAADYMGMLATCINGLALQAVLESQHKIHTRVMTAILSCPPVVGFLQIYRELEDFRHSSRKLW